MQYTQLKQVVEIENQITNLHKELSNLYIKRALFTGNTKLGQFSTQGHAKIRKTLDTSQFHDPWLSQTYNYLASAWLVYGLVIPPFVTIEKKLLKARKVIETIIESDQNIGQQMGVLLVPPSALMSFPVDEIMRQEQSHVLLNDYIDPELLSAGKKSQNKWQVMVVYTNQTGLDYGSAAIILKHGKHVFAGYDMRELGLRQYVALTLQLNQVMDQNIWTVLIGDTPISGRLVPSATFLKGQYRFELDEYSSNLGEERFRPAMEIKG